MAVSTDITFLHRVEAFVYNAVMNRFARMPFDKASDAGAGWLRAIGPLTPAHRTALNNLRMAYPNESEAWRHEIADACWAELGRVTAEFPHLPEISFAPGNGRVELKGAEHLQAVRDSGKGAVFISGHFSSYEIMPIAIVQSGVACVMTYRPANNPLVDKTWLDIRQRYGAKLQAAKSREGGMGLLRALKRGDSVALMNDQKYNEGVAAPFFGYDAMTADGPARLFLQESAVQHAPLVTRPEKIIMMGFNYRRHAAEVGMLGASCVRSLEVTNRPRARPEVASGSRAVHGSMKSCTLPDIRSVLAGAVPL